MHFHDLLQHHNETFLPLEKGPFFQSNFCRRLNNEDFEFLSSGIVAVFPTEDVDIYFIPPIRKKFSKTKKSVTSRGKLVDKYRNKIRDYRRLISDESSKKLSGAEATNPSKNGQNYVFAHLYTLLSICWSCVAHNLDFASSIRESIKWLNNNQAPWETVLIHWKRTAKYRRDSIIEIADKNVNAIVEAWPILRNPNGYALINEDFAYLALTEKSLDIEKWKEFYEKLQSCRSLKKSMSDALELTTTLEQQDLSDGKVYSSFNIPLFRK